MSAASKWRALHVRVEDRFEEHQARKVCVSVQKRSDGDHQIDGVDGHERATGTVHASDVTQGDSIAEGALDSGDRDMPRDPAGVSRQGLSNRKAGTRLGVDDERHKQQDEEGK